VDDVEATRFECEPQVRTRPDRDAHPAAPRDRHRGADRDHLRVRAVEERAPAGAKVGRAVRRREHGDLVAELAQLPRGPGDVLVHVVRLRPRERRDETDPEAHPGSL
jgi:hypothetical protein